MVDDADEAHIQRGTELKVTPHSPGLRGRIWYGSGHLASAEGAAAQRLRLITGTILHSADPELSFSEYQARLIAAYRAAWPGPEEAPPVGPGPPAAPGRTCVGFS